MVRKFLPSPSYTRKIVINGTFAEQTRGGKVFLALAIFFMGHLLLATYLPLSRKREKEKRKKEKEKEKERDGPFFGAKLKINSSRGGNMAATLSKHCF